VRLTAGTWLTLIFACVGGCNFRIIGPDDRSPRPGDDLATRAGDDLSAGEPTDAAIVPRDVAMPDSPADLARADAAPTTPLPVRIHVNGAAFSGGSDYPGSWAADPGVGGVCNGVPYSTTVAIRGTSDDALFQTEMAGASGNAPLTCAVHGLPAGQYTVTLLFAEIYFGPGCPGGGGGNGARVFDIVLEGNTVAADVDLFALGRCAASTSDKKGKPVVRSFDVQVDDGTLDIALPASVDHGKISAIQVVAK
jgi:hypothetical protein